MFEIMVFMLELLVTLTTLGVIISVAIVVAVLVAMFAIAIKSGIQALHEHASFRRRGK